MPKQILRPKSSHSRHPLFAFVLECPPRSRFDGRKAEIAFELKKFIPKVHPAVFQSFIDEHGSRKKIEWQEPFSNVAFAIEAALASNTWAYGAMEHAELISANGGRELLRSAGHYRSDLMPGVDDPERTDETCAIWLATKDPNLFNQIVSSAYAMKGLGTRSWDAFTVDSEKQLAVDVDNTDKMMRFRIDVENFLTKQRNVPTFRTLVVDHYRHRTSRLDTHSLRPWVQVNVYADLAPETREVVTSHETIDQIQLPRTYRASILCDTQKKTIEVIAKGGLPVRDGLVDLFRHHLLPTGLKPERLTRRLINFELFQTEPKFDFGADDAISNVVVDEVRLLPPSSEGGLVTLERKRVHGRPISVYKSAETWFGGKSPIGRPGWNFLGVRLRLTFKPDGVGQKERVRTIELRSPRGTSLREKTDADHAAAEKLFTRWGVFKDENADDDE